MNTPTAVPLAVSNGAPIHWLPDRDTHLLIAGAAGSGKTALLEWVASTVAGRGWGVWILPDAGHPSDELTVPQAKIRAADADASLTVLGDAHALMMQRLELLARGGAYPADFDPVLVVVDAWTTIVAAASLRRGCAGDLSPAEVARGRLVRIVRLARPTNVHLAVATQRPGGAPIASEIGNFAARIGIGRLSSPAAALMWGEAHIGHALGGAAVGPATLMTSAGIVTGAHALSASVARVRDVTR